MPQFLLDSNLHKKVAKNILEPFNVMTPLVFRRSVEKAFQLDQQPTGLTLNPTKPLSADPPFITSAVDDVMYIVSQVLQRSLATSSRTVMTSVVPGIGRVLGSDFVGMIQRKMRDESYPKAIVQGALPPEDKVIAFLVLINNLDIANDYISRIISAHLNTSKTPGERPSLQDLFPFNNDAVVIGNTLKNMQSSFESKTSELLNDSINVTFHQVMKPRIRTILTEAFRDIDYNLSSEDIEVLRGESDTTDLDDWVKTRFERGWRALTLPIKRILTERNYDRLLSQAMSALNKSLESRVRSYYGRVNELGAVRMERDIAGIIAAAVQGGRYAHRDAFQRVQQMCLIMNMEEEEWDEVECIDDMVEGGAERRSSMVDLGIQWVLDRDERKRARGIVSG